MKRVAVLFLGIVVLAMAPAIVSAQGLFGAGLPGLPSMGGFFGGSSSCGDKALGFPGPTLYVGWGATDRPTAVGVGAEHLGVGGVSQLDQRYYDRGLWLGVTQPLTLNEYFSVLASGWYLIPVSNNTGADDSYNNGALGFRTWTNRGKWWFVDGIAALTCKGGCSILVGARYDYYTVKFSDPDSLTSAVGGAGGDEADAISQGVIPLIGTQYALNNATTNLVFRVVGIPTLVGTFSYRETIAGAARLETKGNYNGGYFLEAFTEYGRKFGGMAGIGVFARWNTTHGKADLDTTLLPAGGSDTFKLGLMRNSWTVGGTFNLNFNLPM
jgi:hypothetical protein